MYKNIVIFGSSGTIGGAFLHLLTSVYPTATVYCFSRTKTICNNKNVICNELINYDESYIELAADKLKNNLSLDLVLVTTGLLHNSDIKPEKSLQEISSEKFAALFAANTIIPALVAKHFLPKLNHNGPAIFAALSARLGSISDNKLGGWYAYRASKAALNMIIKTSAIEMARVNPNAIIIGLHPGTVDSSLSRPFQKNVPDDKLFNPEHAVIKLLEVINKLQVKDSGKCFAWDGQEILP